ncbi:MAG TPA: indole-3-glycerol phosphate synthase TrpC [Chitinophagaceae bacterium]|nr:indole-3-glycerol phosphate synthase TrpC [Chitinophagaceae bacterium]
MNILETIIAHKRQEVAQRKAHTPVSRLEHRPGFSRTPLSLRRYLLDEGRTGIIAEFKRKSPSRGIIHATADVVTVTRGYAAHGASALSVLTDETFFGGSDEDLVSARVNDLPLLRKDFVIDEYQVLEARSLGADAILLIAACLSPDQVKSLATLARSLGLEVLLELHAEEELGHVCEQTDIVGINNRDLKTFVVDTERSLAMARRLPADKIKVAESGIHSPDTIILFRENGFRGFLIGENFMKEADPTIAFALFVEQLKAKAHAT